MVHLACNTAISNSKHCRDCGLRFFPLPRCFSRLGAQASPAPSCGHTTAAMSNPPADLGAELQGGPVARPCHRRSPGCKMGSLESKLMRPPVCPELPQVREASGSLRSTSWQALEPAPPGAAPGCPGPGGWARYRQEVCRPSRKNRALVHDSVYEEGKHVH